MLTKLSIYTQKSLCPPFKYTMILCLLKWLKIFQWKQHTGRLKIFCKPCGLSLHGIFPRISLSSPCGTVRAPNPIIIIAALTQRSQMTDDLLLIVDDFIYTYIFLSSEANHCHWLYDGECGECRRREVGTYTFLCALSQTVILSSRSVVEASLSL